MNRLLGASLAMFCGAVGGHILLAAEPAKVAPVPDAVAAEDLLTKIKIIGLLGRPLGEIVEVKGVWIAAAQSKAGQPICLQVKEVSGKPVTKRVEFLRPDVEGRGFDKRAEPKVGDAWTMRALETGGIVGLPEEAFAKPVQQPYGYCFRTRLFILSLKGDAP